jgi:hypothetical protein
MRTIKFRGKRVDTGEWVYGDLYRIMGFGTGPHWLIGTAETEDYKDPEVDPETVGQFTGLKDKDGREICEGDILSYGPWSSGTGLCLHVVRWSRSAASFVSDEGPGGNDLIDMGIDEAGAGVIGNIHDNPELLEATK